jgi:hypothetical protein
MGLPRTPSNNLEHYLELHVYLHSMLLEMCTPQHPHTRRGERRMAYAAGKVPTRHFSLAQGASEEEMETQGSLDVLHCACA